MIELYKALSYGHKKEVCKVIAQECKRQAATVRNWFLSTKVPDDCAEITMKYLQLETIKMNIQFCENPEMLFEMNKIYRGLSEQLCNCDAPIVRTCETE